MVLRERKRTGRGAFAMMNLAFTLLLVGIIVVGVIFAYKAIKGNLEVKTAGDKTVAILQTIDNMCRQNFDHCPAESTNNIATDGVISNYLPADKTLFYNITYNCAQGVDSTITIHIPNRLFHQDPTRAIQICKAVANKINSMMKAWKADSSTCGSGYLTVTSAHRNCQPY